ncbi:MAG: class I SAM-dependent methyltransferase [Candidatus Hinthialibacter antarcticus]|nr:class I SAM-dependent methyltransferase [Candidatus Hinthialibacter antarcticus]
MKYRLDDNDFAQIIGIQTSELPDGCIRRIREFNLSYEELDAQQHENVVHQVVRRILEDDFSISGEKRKEDWENGWRENFDAFVDSQNDLQSLVPKFIRPNPLLRFRQRYIQTQNPRFEWELFQIYRYWFFERFLKNVSSIYEFACGTGYNFVALNELFPNKPLYGLDWAQSAVDLVNELARTHQFNLHGRAFDFFHPDQNFCLAENSAVLTICGLEQVGTNFDPFLNYLFQQRPSICVHMEPWREAYDDNNLVDYLAKVYHDKRGYLAGFYPKLEQLEAEGKIEIIFKNRLNFGSLFHEGYSLIVWKLCGA